MNDKYDSKASINGKTFNQHYESENTQAKTERNEINWKKI